MLKRLAICLISFSSVQAYADISVARCHIVDSEGAELLSLKPLYPVRHWSRYRIDQNLFVDFRYNYFTSSVSFRTTSVPHYPWTFSEAVIDQGTLLLSGVPAPQGEFAIDHPRLGARIVCQESKQT